MDKIIINRKQKDILLERKEKEMMTALGKKLLKEYLPAGIRSREEYEKSFEVSENNPNVSIAYFHNKKNASSLRIESKKNQILSITIVFDSKKDFDQQVIFRNKIKNIIKRFGLQSKKAIQNGVEEIGIYVRLTATYDALQWLG